MAYILEFVESAKLELIDITEYIALDSLPNAERFVASLVEKYTKTLTQFPESGIVYRGEIRKLSFRGYTAFYKIDETNKTVYVLHIIDQAKPLEKRGIDI